jgi:hypothetical protein
MPRPKTGEYSTILTTSREGYAEFFRLLFLAKIAKGEREGDTLLRRDQLKEIGRRIGVDETTLRKFLTKDNRTRKYFYEVQRPDLRILMRLARLFGDVVVDAQKMPIHYVWDNDDTGHYESPDEGYRITIYDLIRQFGHFLTFTRLANEVQFISFTDMSEQTFTFQMLKIAQHPFFTARPSKWLNDAVKHLTSNDDRTPIAQEVAKSVMGFLEDPDPYGDYSTLIDHLNARWVAMQPEQTAKQH